MYANRSQIAVMEAVKQGPCTLRMLEVYTGLAPVTLQKALCSLRKAGLIKHTSGGTYDERWSVTANGKVEPLEPRKHTGRAKYAEDETILRAVEETGSIEGAARKLDYVHRDWIRRRLRRMGLPPGKPNQPYAKVLEA